jgi:hypothetical protein
MCNFVSNDKLDILVKSERYLGSELIPQKETIFNLYGAQ